MPASAMSLSIMFLQPVINVLLRCPIQAVDDEIHLDGRVVSVFSVPVLQILQIQVQGIVLADNWVPYWC